MILKNRILDHSSVTTASVVNVIAENVILMAMSGTMDINKVVDNLGDDPDGGLEEEQVGAKRMKDKYELYSLMNRGKVMITMQLYNSLFDYSINKLLAQ